MEQDPHTATIFYADSATAETARIDPGWYYRDDEYPDEGVSGPYETSFDAWEAADRSGYRAAIATSQTAPRIEHAHTTTGTPMSQHNPVAPPLAPSPLTGMDDLAAATYTVSATQAILWDDLHPDEQNRWRETVGYLLCLIDSLPPYWHNQSPELERLRGTARSARNIAEIEMRRVIRELAEMDRIKREVAS